MWRQAVFLCSMVTVTACGQSSPTSPTPITTTEHVERAHVPDGPSTHAPDPQAPDANTPARKSDEHVEPPSNVPPPEP
jgi:hypothetical protein